MGQSPSSIRRKGSRQGSFRNFVRRSKLNKSNLSHTFNLTPSDEYSELMNVNTATEEQLMTLPGVSRQLAQEIVRHRQMIGRFKRVDDLALVSGIGAEKLELLRPEICINTRRQLSRASSCTYSLDSVRVSSENKLCSVNSSSVFQLQCVPGLNQELAANIVDYRNKKGPFKSLDDLIKVRGIDIVRLSTVKPHLNLEPRKFESVQHLNGHVNGWANMSSGSLPNGISIAPRTPHRKSMSMPTKFPNGFAAAPVNDILDLLSAYSHRPIVEELFMYERDGVRCCRLASWNLHQLSMDKVMNPGVREVMCLTILENKFTIMAVQDVLDEAALKILCDELNSPVLRRVREWRSGSNGWEYCISKPINGQCLGFLFETVNRFITVEDIDLDQLYLLSESADARRLVAELSTLCSSRYVAVAQAFLISGRPIVMINVCCTEQLNEEDSAILLTVTELAESSKLQLVVLGEFGTWDNVQCLKSCEPLLEEAKLTAVDSASEGRSSILSPGPGSGPGARGWSGRAGVVRAGLSHLAIPRGWSWGGAASPHCPVWAELNVPD